SRRMTSGHLEAVAVSLGYAAVYVVGLVEWSQWQQHALLQSSVEPYGLGDFLFLLDPAAPEWSAHLAEELSEAVAVLGFDGFHLDQYGYPRRAVRTDGSDVDLSDSFVQLIESVRRGVPEA